MSIECKCEARRRREKLRMHRAVVPERAAKEGRRALQHKARLLVGKNRAPQHRECTMCRRRSTSTRPLGDAKMETASTGWLGKQAGVSNAFLVT